MVWSAHIAGTPEEEEETARSFAPVIAATGGNAEVQFRARVSKRRIRLRRQVGKAGGRR
jgi:hypothetical protein